MMTSTISRRRKAFASAVLIQLLVGIADGIVYVAHHGIPHVAFPLLVVGLYGFTGLAIGTLVVAVARSRTDVSRWAAFAAMVFAAVPLVFTRGLPESVNIGTPLGIIVLLFLLVVLYGAAGAWDRRGIGQGTPGRWIRIVVVGVVVVGLFSWAERWKNPFRDGATPPAGPDILVLVMDTLRADYADSGRMPELAALAEDGVVFERALSVSCFTPPPHATLLTGNYPVRHGVRGGQRFLADANRTLGEILAERGYATIAVVSNLSLASVFGWDQGFGIYDDSLVAPVSPGVWLERTPAIVVWVKLGFSPRLAFLRLAQRLGMVDHVDAAATVDHFLEAVDRVGDRPVFAFVNFMDPHFPYRTPAQRGDMEVNRVNAALDPVLRSVGHAGRGVDTEVAEKVSGLYDGEVRYLDGEVGRLVDEWKARGRWDRSLVIVTADHGEHLGDHARYFHTNSLYRELVQVPMVFRFPSDETVLPRGIRVDEAVSLVDVAPTILDWIGAPGGQAMHGESLLPRIEGDEPTSRTVVSEWNENRALVWDNYKAFFEDGRLVSVVDVDGDETEDLARDRPALRDEAAQRYADWESVFAAGGTVDIGGETVDPVMQDRLRALGYVE